MAAIYYKNLLDSNILEASNHTKNVDSKCGSSKFRKIAQLHYL